MMDAFCVAFLRYADPASISAWADANVYSTMAVPPSDTSRREHSASSSTRHTCTSRIGPASHISRPPTSRIVRHEADPVTYIAHRELSPCGRVPITVAITAMARCRVDERGPVPAHGSHPQRDTCQKWCPSREPPAVNAFLGRASVCNQRNGMSGSRKSQMRACQMLLPGTRTRLRPATRSMSGYRDGTVTSM